LLKVRVEGGLVPGFLASGVDVGVEVVAVDADVLAELDDGDPSFGAKAPGNSALSYGAGNSASGVMCGPCWCSVSMKTNSGCSGCTRFSSA
jgi:hypothetical protein